ncbi:MAG: polysaccharide deacetylase family protein [Hyphomicrobiales bacterium]|nr:polysaccharide deacetylase family protein [Hyphomicrobiales bacterium]
MNSGLIRIGLDAFYYSGGHALMSRFCRGIGVIFTLHRVRPRIPEPFHPNRILEVSPEFLESVIVETRRQGHEFVSLDEAHRRITEPGDHRPFACLTFDDGYRDNRDVAYPILKRHNCPFAVYVATSFAAGTGNLWWLALEEIIRDADCVDIVLDGRERHFETGTPREKEAAFSQIYWGLRRTDERRQRQIVSALAARHDVDLARLCARLVMGWGELRTFAREPLVTIGAHSVHHYSLAKLSEDEARAEIEGSVRIIGEKLGERPRHFAFPYGDAGSAGPREFRLAAELGLKTAATTRKGVVFAEHRQHPTGLPRVSLNGDYQSPHYVDLFLGGAPFLLWNGFRRLNVA